MVCLAAATAAPFQRRTAHKLRATAVVELTTGPNGVVTPHVIPITILANNAFRDAAIYESRPRPMALANDVVYEVQKTGVPLGYVTITNGTPTPQGWIAQGRWQPAGAARPKETPKPPAPSAPAAAPANDRPILHRQGEEPPQPTPTPTPQSKPEADDTGRPVLHRPSDAPSQDTTPPGKTDSGGPTLHRQGEEHQPSPSPSPDSTQQEPSDSDRPVLHRRGGETQSPSQPIGGPQTSTEAEPLPSPDPNRPLLRRGKPTGAHPDIPTPVEAGSTPSSSASPAGIQTFVAVSDAQSTETRPFVYHWQPGEEEQIESKMRKLALAQLPRDTEQAMTNVVVRSFDLDLSNDAVVVITAEVPAAPLGKGTASKSERTPGTKSAPEKLVRRYVAVIARVDIDGNPQKLAGTVTDSTRLDVAPRLELIDAVDVDGDGVAELLFREYGFDQTTYIVYGVGHGTVTKLFEGASRGNK